jgi:Ca-activated chloride channel family protein
MGRWVRLCTLMLRTLAICALVVALSRPQTVAGRVWISAQGVAIMIALDQSSSMKARDVGGGLEPESRLEAARATIDRFVKGRPDDLLGLVVFANYPDLAVPLTLDHRALREAVRDVGPAGPVDDGTNLGDALAWALNALKDTAARRKVIILLTDGANEPAVPRPLDPLEAARLAHDLGVRLYTIAVAPRVRQVDDSTGLTIAGTDSGPNLQLLRDMAATGGGRAFEAADSRALDEIFAEIDRLERSPLTGEIRTRYREHYPLLIGLAILALIVDRVLESSRWRSLP